MKKLNFILIMIIVSIAVLSGCDSKNDTNNNRTIINNANLGIEQKELPDEDNDEADNEDTKNNRTELAELIETPLPSAKSVGICYKNEQEDIFKELVGEYYEEFIDISQYYRDIEDKDNLGMKVRIFGKKGYGNSAIVMVDDIKNQFMTAIDGEDGICYFSNVDNEKFSNEPPKTIDEWVGNRVISVNGDNKDNEDQEEDSKNKRAYDAIPEEIIEYINKKDSDTQIVYFKEEDMDVDGVSEFIIGTSLINNDLSYEYFSEVYVLRLKEGNVKELEGDYVSTGYSINNINLVKLDNLPNKYLYCGLTNGVNIQGFVLYGLKDDKIYKIDCCVCPSGDGEDVLVDENQDGQYDGYKKSRSDSYTYHYHVNYYYNLIGEKFQLDRISFDLPPYPITIKEVTMQYLQLRSLDLDSIEIVERLNELCQDEEADKIDTSFGCLHYVLQNSSEIGPEMNFDIDEENKIAILMYEDEDNLFKYIFHMIKKGDRWIIDDIELDWLIG
ncbi:hypothetical protein SH1V18_37690 [Vallitalea longa]|uniref:Uncharacterized protein n=1 Tax=Vallitalea longa TaxID=2936439 RepID=A0A9W5YDY5_9FIRM|nr:hypothetical protein [Vallitalea longa]GKX31289.1 hypothetical protein SH1V18_37690 [Vallitalea longa]